MWVCKDCGSNNDDSLTACEVCGCTDKLEPSVDSSSSAGGSSVSSTPPSSVSPFASGGTSSASGPSGFSPSLTPSGVSHPASTPPPLSSTPPSASGTSLIPPSGVSTHSTSGTITSSRRKTILKIIIAVVYFVVVGIISIPLWLADYGLGAVFIEVTIPVGVFYTLLIGCKNLKWGTLLTKIIDIFACVLTFIFLILSLFSLSHGMGVYILANIIPILVPIVPIMIAVNIVYSVILIKHGNKKLGIVSIIIPLIALGLQVVFIFVPVIAGY